MNDSAAKKATNAGSELRATDWLGPCAKCGQQWALPTITHLKEDVVFGIQCGACGHAAERISLKPAIAYWNKPERN